MECSIKSLNYLGPLKPFQIIRFTPLYGGHTLSAIKPNSRRTNKHETCKPEQK